MGYKIIYKSITEGADIKRGYEISDLISSPAQTSGWGNENQFTFKNFKKENSSEIKAVIIIHYFNKVAKTVYCIPLANSDKSLWQSFYLILIYWLEIRKLYYYTVFQTYIFRQNRRPLFRLGVKFN